MASVLLWKNESNSNPTIFRKKAYVLVVSSSTSMPVITSIFAFLYRRTTAMLAWVDTMDKTGR